MSSSCSCGSDCKCGSGCKCGMHIDLGYSETTSIDTIIAGVAPVKMSFEGSEMNYGAENDCKCGSNCSCSSCGCNK
ncbi:hypothetical protein C1H46_040728 [Malus baccata]|uniref:Metallothionein-like protein n=2 Tax=Malus TaxID=3749 RepID=A0A498KFL8_MALDO|nr:hypothetical protein DVH24_038656 [Malus domestica]TQD73743.1 hypothetical protein C1H46_040728 [Malus baccata]